MKVTRVIGKAMKPLVNFPRWMGLDEIKSTGKNIGDLAKDVFTIKEAEHDDTFERAAARLDLKDEEIQKRAKSFLQLATIYVLFGVALFAYAIYLGFWKFYILPTFMTFMLSALSFAFAYREHFWYFQMKTKKLGQTYKDWFAFVFKGASK